MTGQLGSESWMRRDASVELGTLRERCACEPEDFEALDTLANIIEAYAAEVKRLMVLLNNEQNAAHENVRQLREASAVTAVNFGKAQAEIAQLQTEKAELIKWGDGWQQQWTEMRDTMWKPAMDKLARVEDGVRRIVVSLGRHVTPSGHAIEPKLREMFAVICSELNAALSDPQPSAAPTPCEHTWISYSRPPMRAVTGRKCTKCALIEEKSKGEPYNGW